MTQPTYEEHPVKRTLTAAVVVVLLVGCNGSSKVKDNGSVTAAGAPEAQTATVMMLDTLSFSPNTVNAKVGTLTLTASNSGLVPHNLVFDDSFLGKTGTVDGKQSMSLKLVVAKAGTFTFKCTFHSGMSGKVVVSS
jgi:plastocyanin